MIIPMKKVTLLCLQQDKVQSLEHLRSLGLMQVTQSAVPDTVDVTALTKEYEDIRSAYASLQSAEPPEKGTKTGDKASSDGKALVARILELEQQRAAAKKELTALERQEEQLAPWGDFSYQDLAALREKGVCVTLCVSQPSVYDARCAGTDAAAFPEGAVPQVIARTKTAVYYVLIQTSGAVQAVPDTVELPEATLAETRAKIAENQQKLQSVRLELSGLVKSMNVVREYAEKVAAKLEFATVRDGMTNAGKLEYVTGYVPETELERLRTGAEEFGWALLIEDPSEDDLQVPTYIRKPKILNVMDPLFDLIGIQPGYRESDVNVFLLIFFPIFFGMIVGDAGYAVLFLLIAFVCKRLLRNKESARLPLNLFILLSFSTLIWGWLNGSWFGIPGEHLPAFMRGWSFIADPQNSPLAQKLVAKLELIKPGMTDIQIQAVWDGLPSKFIQYFCFILAAVQLGSARLFKFIDGIRYSWRAFGDLGWACVILGNFFTATSLIVFPGTFPATLALSLYGTGFVLVLVTISGTAILNLPFDITGSFVDVLSYIRLFAVGLSGTYIAVNFNKMGTMLLDALPDQLVVLGFILLIIVAVFGHVLNIALCFLSVMVHAIRLNTLEFSNHMGMQWTGIKFHPFSNRNSTEQK